jgi:hypothetical protein
MPMPAAIAKSPPQAIVRGDLFIVGAHSGPVALLTQMS